MSQNLFPPLTPELVTFVEGDVSMLFATRSAELRPRSVRALGLKVDAMSLRIQAIASHTGMAGVFKLRSADVFEVLSIERVEGFLEPSGPEQAGAEPDLADAPLTELRGLQIVSERVNRASDLDTLLRDSLDALDDVFGFDHA